jgi:hypothetical protein
MRRIIYMSLALALAGCGGNYSNDDVDYQLALPERDDIAVKLPAQMLEVACSAEYFKSTRDVTKTFNGIADAFLGLIDYVRSYPPSERNGTQRVWGPFLNHDHPNWEVRMVIDRVTDPDGAMRFVYSIEFRAAKLPALGWHTLISGYFAPAGGVRQGTGQLKFLPAEARTTQYPLDGLKDFDTLTIDYDTKAFPISVKLTIISFPARDSAEYQYHAEADGSGTMDFRFPTPAGVLLGVSEVAIHSRWKGSAAGRADVVVTKGFAAGAEGTDCWGIDTCPTWVHRDWAPAMDTGMESSCVFPARSP